jgi:hypothetical protein
VTSSLTPLARPSQLRWNDPPWWWRNRKQETTVNNLIKFALTSLVVSTSFAGTAAADRCKNVDIHVHNDFVHDGDLLQIKVVDFDYWDDGEGKWREESWIGNTIYSPTEHKHLVNDRNLEYVGNERDVAIRVQYKYLTSNNGWSETLNALSAPFFCSDGYHADVYVK